MEELQVLGKTEDFFRHSRETKKTKKTKNFQLKRDDLLP